LEVIRIFIIIHLHHCQLYHFYPQNKSAALASKIIQTNKSTNEKFFFHHGKDGNALGLLRLSLRESSSLCSSVNLTPSAQANLRDTEMVDEGSLCAIRPQIVRNTLEAFISGVARQTPFLMPKAFKKNDTVKRTDKRLENAKH